MGDPMPSNSDERMVRLLEAELRRVAPVAARWEIDREALVGWRIASPVDPCERCRYRVYLILVDGDPRWVRIGAVRAGVDPQHPVVEQRLHECGDGDSWSVEAALFAEDTMAEWGSSR